MPKVAHHLLMWVGKESSLCDNWGMNKVLVLRIRLIALGLILAAIIIISRLFFIQIVRNEYFSDQADRQYTHAGGQMFNRGSIIFTTKDGSEVSAATLKTGFILAINPSNIKNAEATYKALNEIVLLDGETFFKKAAKVGDPYEELVNRVEVETADKITALKLPGVHLYKERWRFYPGNNLASHTLGLLGFKGDEFLGRYGLEKQYETTLHRSSNKSFVNFFAEVFSELGDSIFASNQPGSSEGDIILTIEPTVQSVLEKELADLQKKWNASSVGGIIMDPNTGEIRAMASLPDFNPGSKQENLNALNNPLVQNAYEMGSIVKPLTMAAGLDAGVVMPQTTYNDKGSLTLNTKTISNFDGKARGVVPMQEVLSQSLNTGSVFVMQKLGKEKFRNYMYGFGLNKKTGIDLPDEAAGLTNNLESTRDIEYATAAFGQGIAITPLSITRALASLGNGGLLVTPHVVKEIRYTSQLTKTIKTPEPKQILKPETSEAVSRMLVKVVDEALIGGKAKMEHYTIGAKTGTAQIAKPKGGGYYDDRYMHTFFGYFPAYEPKFIVFLYVREPVGVKYASETLTGPFSNLTKFLINYYQIPPDR